MNGFVAFFAIWVAFCVGWFARSTSRVMAAVKTVPFFTRSCSWVPGLTAAPSVSCAPS